MKKSSSTNVFSDGMVMDINPLVTPNNVVSNALNATLLTMNGNENVLQNDMGNGRVQTAYLPEGYIPLGTAELGGIIYIVSYNPLLNKCQVGSFPSPQRNVTIDKIFKSSVDIDIDNSVFYSKNYEDEKDDKKTLLNLTLKVKLFSEMSEDEQVQMLHPGDKYTIYSTNSGITNNSQCISDVGNPLHSVDTLPRNVTIHVISIGEDGSITYLDDTLKWESIGTVGDYYIKECDGGVDQVQTDIDSYRSLVSSAYNVFQSKVSGELALLLELKVIDTFSVTWDAEVSDFNEVTLQGYDKEAIITFYVNYTSSNPVINPKYILITDSTREGEFSMSPSPSSRSVLKYELPNELLLNRKNDGSDEDIQIQVGTFRYRKSDPLLTNIWKYQIIPYMPFGGLSNLAISNSIDFSSLGTGNIELNEWRYYIQDSDFYLNYSLAIYPEKNKSVKQVIFTFMPFEEIKYEFGGNSTVIVDNSIPPSSQYPTYIDSNRKSYSGTFQLLLPFGENLDIQNGQLLKDYLYLVDICPVYGNNESVEYRHTYRWLYTTKQWNSKYLDSSITTFDSLYLDIDSLQLVLEPSMTADNTETYKYSYDGAVIIPETITSDNTSAFQAMTSKITEVNMGDKTGYIWCNDTLKCKISETLFQFSNVNSYDGIYRTIEDTHISIEPNTVTSENISEITQYVLPIVKQDNELDQDIQRTIDTIKANGIQNEEINNKASDQFKAQFYGGGSGKFYHIIFKGVIFSKINCGLTQTPVEYTQEIKPVLGFNADLSKLGLGDVYKEQGQELQGFGFNSHSYVQTHKDDPGEGILVTYEDVLVSGSAVSRREPEDYFRKNYWYDVDSYNNALLPVVNRGPLGISLISWFGDSGGKDADTVYTHNGHIYQGGVYFGGAPVRTGCNLLVRTDNGYYLPINCFCQNQKSIEIGTLAALFYMSLYTASTSSYIKDTVLPTYINYMTNYTETWSADIRRTCSNQFEDYLYLCSQKGNLQVLQELQETCTDINDYSHFHYRYTPINLNNISFRKDVAEVDLGMIRISHSFYLSNDSLKNKYDSYRNAGSKAIAWISTQPNYTLVTPIDPGQVYTYNQSTNTFVPISASDTYKRMYIGGTIRKVQKESSKEYKFQITDPVYNQSTLHIVAAVSSITDNGIYFSWNTLLRDHKQLRFTTNTASEEESWVEYNSNYNLGKLIR